MKNKIKEKKGGLKVRRRHVTKFKMQSSFRHEMKRRMYFESNREKKHNGFEYMFNADLGIKDDKPVFLNSLTASLFVKEYTPSEFTSIYMQYPTFREIIESGDYLIYKNRIRYACKEVEDLVLTDWIESVVGGLNSAGGGDDGDDDFDPEKVDNKTKELMELLDNFFKEPHISFSAALKFTLDFLKVSGAKLSSLTGISTSTISKMLHEDKYNTPKHEEKTIVTICLALKIPPMISEELLRLAGCPLSKSNELHRAYLTLLNCFYPYGLKVSNNFLITRKLPKLIN